MKTYIATVAITYYQRITVESETENDAKMLMCERFDLYRADAGDPDFLEFQEAEDQAEEY